MLQIHSEELMLEYGQSAKWVLKEQVLRELR